MPSCFRLFKMVLTFGAVLIAATSLCAQDMKNAEAGVPHDWSHHHVVFSNPGTADQAIEEGRYGEWLKIVNDPRFQLQQIKREAAAKANLNPGQLLRPAEREPGAEAQESEMLEDSEEISRAETEESIPVGEERELFRHRPRPRPRPRPKRFRNNLQKDWQASMGSSSNAVENTYPAKYSFSLTTANCGNAPSPDFVVVPAGTAGSSTQANMIAFDNLYTGCPTGTVPSTYWAYNTGGTSRTSAVLSLDGSQVAFTQIDSSRNLILVILKWAAGTGTAAAPVTLTSTAAAFYRGCTAPCMTTFSYSTASLPVVPDPQVYYDYGSDTAFVGDDNGRLYEFTGVFNGTPAEAGSPWPVTINGGSSSNLRLTAPLYDPVSGNVFVGDHSASSSCGSAPTCGFLYSVNASTGAVTKSAQLDSLFGLRGGLLLDPVAGKVYASVAHDIARGASGVFQFPTNFSANSSGVEAQIGPAVASNDWIEAGTFDNAYLTSGNGASPTGHLYLVCSGQCDNILYQVPITSNVMGTPVQGPKISNSFSAHAITAWGYSVSEVFTGSHDYIFTGIEFWAVPAACGTPSASNGCVMGFDVTSGTITTTTAPTGASSTPGAPSGIVVDNIATSPAGTSNVYYTMPCGSGGSCLVQNSQTSP